MHKYLLIGCFLLLGLARPVFAQHAQGSLGTGLAGLIAANEFSKDESLYRAKEYVLNTVLEVRDEPVKFEAYALAASTSGEVTSLVYKCDEKKREGLLLAFYGLHVNEQGMRYQAYAFKDLPKAKAVELIAKLNDVMEKQSIYMRTDSDNNNVSFRYDDMAFLLYRSNAGENVMRVFWGQFDAEWNISAFHKTERRMVKKI